MSQLNALELHPSLPPIEKGVVDALYTTPSCVVPPARRTPFIYIFEFRIYNVSVVLVVVIIVK
jgi:hypothetical protein